MLTQWTFFLARRQVPELRTEPLAIRFHLAAELATALALIIGGVGQLAQTGWSQNAYLVATGMLFYTLVNSAGYFAQRRQWPMVITFGVLFGLALAGLALVL